MADDILRIQAVVVDRSTGPLRQIAAAMRTTKVTGADRLAGGFAELRRQVAPLARELQVGLIPALGAFGLTGAGVIASLAGMAKWVNTAAKSSVGLGFMSRELNFSRKELAEWKAVGQDLQIDDPIKGLDHFSKMMFNVRNRTQEGREAMNFLRLSGLPGLAVALESASKSSKGYGDAQRVVQKSLQQLTDEQKKAYLAQFFFADWRFSRMSLEQFNKTLQNHGPIVDEDVNALERYDSAINKLDASWEKLKRTMAGKLAGPLTGLIDNINKLLSHTEGYDDPEALKNRAGQIARSRRESRRAREMMGIPGSRDNNVLGAEEWGLPAEKMKEESKKTWQKFWEFFIKSGAEGMEFGGGGLRNASFGGGFGGMGGGGGLGANLPQGILDPMGRRRSGSSGGGGVDGPINIPQGAGMRGTGGRMGAGYQQSGLSVNDVSGYIRQEATKRGIDPNFALWVARGEGLTTYKSSVPGERSYGPYQLYMGGGLGNVFKKQTGIDPETDRSARSIMAQIQFSLDWAAKHKTWKPWNAVKNRGGNMFGGFGPNTRPAGIDLSSNLDKSLKTQTGNSDGRANISVDFKGTPRGTEVKAGTEGNLFKPVETNVQYSPQMQVTRDYSLFGED